ncbi:MAG: cupin domain-containing protein [Steroidobacteraceae bacterium]
MNANKAEAPVSAELAEFGKFVESRIARLKTRTYDFDALKFQADFDPKYRRAQMRYIGTGAAGVAHDENVVPAEHFTLSTMLLPGGSVGPLHVHDDVEEVFFVLRGSVKVMAKKGDLYYESLLNERDLISVPPGVYRGVINEGEEDVIMCVMLGSSKPRLPTYPPDHPLSKIDRHKK